MSSIVEIAEYVRAETRKSHQRPSYGDTVLERVIHDLSADEVDVLLAEFQADGQYSVGTIPFTTFGSFCGISTLEGAILGAKQAILFAALKRLIDNTWGSDFAAKLKYLQGVA